MATSELNYMLGAAESLSKRIDPPPLAPRKEAPYTAAEVVGRVKRQAVEVTRYVSELPSGACPRDEAVAKLILHPQYLSKSAFPGELLRSVGLELIGSRPITHKPDKVGRTTPPREEATSQLFLKGSRRDLVELPARLEAQTGKSKLALQMPALEQLSPMTAEDRVKPSARAEEPIPVEIVLHAGRSQGQHYRLDALYQYADKLGIEVDPRHLVRLDDLCFLGAIVPPDLMDKFAEFAYIRALRRLSRLRALTEPVRFTSVPGTIRLPDPGNGVDGPKVAIFDGGYDPKTGLDPWVTAIECPGVGQALAKEIQHGVGVTSAALFGPIDMREPNLLAPPFRVDNYRVLGTGNSGDYELLDVLKSITDVLATKHYDLINISLGPDMPCLDDDVSAWSSTLDAVWAHGRTLPFVAVGNNGRKDAARGLNRILAPADGVNVIGIGAADRPTRDWRRADYSAVGPGRSPGVVKPDAMAFGGSTNTPFVMLSVAGGGQVVSACGTSFASPNAMHTAGTIMHHMGPQLTPLGVKAAILHHADPRQHPRSEVGRGLIECDLKAVLASSPNTYNIIYQGVLDPMKFERFRIPEPPGGFLGNVEVSVTIVFACDVDSASPENYTRAGIEVTWRPHSDNIEPDATYAKSKPFVSRGSLGTEQELRRDAHKWETVLQTSATLRSTSIHEPVLDLHYNPRKGGQPTLSAGQIPYAMLVSVRCKKMPDLYNRVRSAHLTELIPLRPRIALQV